MTEFVLKISVFQWSTVNHSNHGCSGLLTLRIVHNSGIIGNNSGIIRNNSGITSFVHDPTANNEEPFIQDFQVRTYRFNWRRWSGPWYTSCGCSQRIVLLHCGARIDGRFGGLRMIASWKIWFRFSWEDSTRSCSMSWGWSGIEFNHW